MSEEYERKGDRIIAQVEQKLTDHMLDFSNTKIGLKEWQTQHVEWCKAEIDRLEGEINPMRSAFRKFETPVRWIGWVVVGTIGGTLIWAGEHLAQWCARHFNG